MAEHYPYRTYFGGSTRPTTLSLSHTGEVILREDCANFPEISMRSDCNKRLL